MSTRECFEAHKEAGQKYEERARMRMEDGVSVLTPKAIRVAVAQLSLAIREYGEAARLRPRDQSTQRRLRIATKARRAMETALEGPKPIALRRFLAHYNLSIRYWDLGKSRQAIAEAEQACEELRRAGLGDRLGCAERNKAVMEHVLNKYREEHQRLMLSVSQAPRNVGRAYELGILYFDKRMLLRAEAQLKQARELAQASSTRQLVASDKYDLQVKAAAENSPHTRWIAAAAPSPGIKNRSRIRELLEDLVDDLDFIASLRQQWCVEEETGKDEVLQETGVRDAKAPSLLPCLHSRFEAEGRCDSCEKWWSMICTIGTLYRKPPKIGAAKLRAAPRLVPGAQRAQWYAAGA